MSMRFFLKNIYLILFILIFFKNSSYAEQVESIKVFGNDRVSSSSIEMFSSVKINQNLNENDINNVLKDLYNTNFFENVSVDFKNNVLKITVKEFPIIQDIAYDGIKSDTLLNQITENVTLKSRSSYNKVFLQNDKVKIENNLKNLGYFFSKIDIFIEELDKNKVNINYKIDVGAKAKIKKISFIGNKIFKDKKLKNIIISEEYKFWKFLSNKKYLNENINNLNKRLLQNFYQDNGYYNVEINSSYAKLLSEDDFELIYNINANEKVFFNDVKLIIPSDFNEENFSSLNNYFLDIKGKPYSMNIISNILDKIDEITLQEQYQSIESQVNEVLNNNLLNLTFSIIETEKVFVEKINIFGNNVTRENVLRNQFDIDEGDPFNEILIKKTVNNLKSLNFFRSVEYNVVNGKNLNSKIINFIVDEKPTGEIFAGAGAGTSGGTVSFGVKENNYLGKGLSVDTNLTITQETIKGNFSVTNPNFKNSDRSIFLNIESNETDQLKDFGYKTNKTGLSIGTNFELYDDLYTAFDFSGYYEVIDTDSTASSRQKAQKGNYLDTFLGINVDLDKRNRKFQTTKGFRSNYYINLPIISDTNTLTNSYNFKYFTELYKENLTTFSYFVKGAKSLTNEDIKLSERLIIPSSMLRGFERGKIGPKDGNDFIGGNFISTMNISTTLPQILPSMQNTDFIIFFDAANIWGVDYDSSIDEKNKIRSTIGIGVDWFTPIGPLNFSLSQPITKANTDITESFRFNIGTTF